MLTKTELENIRESLENSQNPLFFFDNDVDGLCSFIILQRAIGRGKGVAIKSFPVLDKSYLKKIEELNPDYVFILDKPGISDEFIEGVMEKNLPLICIDHHESKIKEEYKSYVNYYNTFPSGEPTTYIAQKVFNKKQDLWIALLGCMSDNFLPDFTEKFAEDNPELLKTTTSAFDCLYKTELGKIARMLDLGMRDTTTNILNLIRLLLKANSPTDIIEENAHTKQLHYKYNQLTKIIDSLLKKAKIGENNVLLEYSGENSLSSEIANKLYYENSEKFILVIYKKPDTANISIRGKNARKILLGVIKNIPGAVGGGHPLACGARIPSDKLEEFKEKMFETIN